MVCQVNCCFNTNCTGFLPGLGENISFSSTCGHQVRLSMCQPLGGCVQFRGEKNHTLNLAIIQVAESSDNLLLVELICLQFHTPHGLHGAIILQTLIASHNHLCGWGFIQFVDIAFLQERKYPEPQRLFYNITGQRSFPLILTLISKVAWVVKSEYVRADMRAAAPCRMAHKNNRFQI